MPFPSSIPAAGRAKETGTIETHMLEQRTFHRSPALIDRRRQTLSRNVPANASVVRA